MTKDDIVREDQDAVLYRRHADEAFRAGVGKFFAPDTIDWEKLRSLPPADQDEELKYQVAAHPELKPRLFEAAMHWHFPYKRAVLQEFQAAFPEVTEADVDAVVACYFRVYGGG